MEVAILLNAPKLNVEITEKFLICVDGGYNLVSRKPDLIIGDCDSIKSIPDDIKIIKLPSEKNLSDGEYAIQYAIDNGADKINIYGGFGGRIDHVICNIRLLKFATKLGAKTVLIDKGLKVRYFNKSFTLNTQKNDLISILPFGGDALIKNSEKVYYPLKNLLLKTDDSRGLSNIALFDKIAIDIEYGEVIVFHYFNS